MSRETWVFGWISLTRRMVDAPRAETPRFPIPMAAPSRPKCSGGGDFVGEAGPVGDGVESAAVRSDWRWDAMRKGGRVGTYGDVVPARLKFRRVPACERARWRRWRGRHHAGRRPT